MTMTSIDTRYWHARFRALDHLAQGGGDKDADNALEAIEKAWDAATDAFKDYGFKWSNDDHAEELIAVLTRYLFHSNPEQLAHVAVLIDAKVEG
jgi:hypothetical protein